MEELSQLESANGRLEPEIDLEELFGTKRTNPFGTNKLEIFEEQLSSMSYTDMQEIARKVRDIDIYASRPNLRLKLLEAFKWDSRNKQHMAPIIIRDQKPSDFDRNDPEHLKVMRELGMKV